MFNDVGFGWYATKNKLDRVELLQYTNKLWGVPGVDCLFEDPESPKYEEILGFHFHRTHLPLLGVSTPTKPPVINHKPPFELRDYQKEAVAFTQNRIGSILNVDLGLGKTSIAIAASKTPFAVLCPTSAIQVWQEELDLWGLTYQVLQGGKPHYARVDKEVDVYIVTYGSSKWLTLFSGVHPARRLEAMIVDEAHYLQKKSLKWSDNLKQVSSKHKILLTATPIRNRLKSLYNLLDVANFRGWGNSYDWRIRYCGAENSPYGIVDKDPSNVHELRTRLSETVFTQNWGDPRLEGLRPDLERFIIDLNPSTKDRYSFTSRAVDHMSGRVIEGGHHLVMSTQLRQEIGLYKARKMVEAIPDLVDKHNRVVIWFWHKTILEITQKALTSEIKIDVVTGSTTRKKRSEIMREWKYGDPKEKRILLATEAAFSAAVSLTSAEAEIFIEYAYAPLDLQQAEKRVHRPGSRVNKVYAYYVRASKTKEDQIIDTLVSKIEEVEDVFGSDPQTTQILEIGE